MTVACLIAMGEGEGVVRAIVLQLGVILTAARLGAVLMRRLGQPAVVGEFLAGLALGPSLLGWWQPELFAVLFRPSLPGMTEEQSARLVEQVLGVLAHLGIIFLMFLVGLEVDGRYFRQNWRLPVSVAAGGFLVPLLVGIPIGYGLAYKEGSLPAGGFFSPTVFFVAAAFAITALPVMARILMDLQVLGTGLARLTLAAAAITDGGMWCLLAGIMAWATHFQGGVGHFGTSVLLLSGFVFLMWQVVRPLGRRYFRAELQRAEGRLGLPAWTVLFVCLLLSAYIASWMGLHAWFGFFFLGVVLGGVPGLAAEVNARLQHVVQGFFIPLFFAYAGLQTNVFAVISVWDWPVCLGVLAAAALVKWVPCTWIARWNGLSWREAALVGSLMNTRGLMGLIVAYIGRDVGALSPNLFAVLVLLAEIMTLMTTPLVLLLARGTEWEVPLTNSGWLRPRSSAKCEDASLPTALLSQNPKL